MSPLLQTLLTFALVGGAAGYFVMRWWTGRRRTGCGGGCGCSPKKKS